MYIDVEFTILMRMARDHMEENGFTPTTVTCYMRTWRSIYNFGISKGISCYSAELAEQYIRRWNINLADSQERYVFTNRSGGQLSRSGIKYILDKYVESAREKDATLLPEKISPHTLRHTKAMHMLQAGNNIVYIRDILGHSDLNTTERYARADTALKMEALSKAEIPMPELDNSLPDVSSDLSGHSIEDDMANWLKNFSK